MTKRQITKRQITKRKRAEKRFQILGWLSMASSLFFLCLLFFFILQRGAEGFFRYETKLTIVTNSLSKDKPRTAILNAFYQTLNIEKNAERIIARKILSRSAPDTLRNHLNANPENIGKIIELWVAISTLGENTIKKNYDPLTPEKQRNIKNLHIKWLEQLQQNKNIRSSFNMDFFTNGATSTAENAGVGIALLGSFYMMLIVAFLSVPIGVATAIYLEEFASKKSRLIRMFELNINNLAAVPSIVFGILGLAVFINFFGMPRSSPLVGGLVLTLMTLPTIVISARSVLRAVPISIKWAAYGVGASQHQAVFHHVLPIALPGIITGAIIGLAQALGETAPLLIIGMVAFIADYPQTILEPASALPVQTFIWSGSPDPGFVTRTAASIIVLLTFLIIMNATAVYLRHKYEKKI